MARPKNAVPTKPLTVHLPVDVLTKLQLHLFSDVDGRVPHGAYSILFSALAKAHLEALPVAATVETPPQPT